MVTPWGGPRGIVGETSVQVRHHERGRAIAALENRTVRGNRAFDSVVASHAAGRWRSW